MSLIRKLINPVISMELRLRMRTKRTPWVISLYLASLGAILFTFIYFETGNSGYFNPNRSRELFILLSFVQFLLISLVTPGLTAGTISGEREKQTLNILLTTSLTPTKIILGKWLSSLSFMIFLILSSMPIYSITFLYGGIAPDQLIKVFGFYIIGMLAIGSFGVLYSTIIKRTGVAIIVTYTTILTYTITTAILPELIKSYYYNFGSGIRPTWIDWIYAINPFFGMTNIFENNQLQQLTIKLYWNISMNPYWVFVAFFATVTIFTLLLAIYFIQPVRKLRLK